MQSSRAALYEAAVLARLDGLRVLLHPAEIRESASAAHGPVGAYPGTCRELTEAERERAAGGRAPCAARGGATVVVRDELLGGHEGSVDDFVVRRNDGASPTTSRSWSTTRTRASRRSRGADLLNSTPRQSSGRALGRPVVVRPRAAGSRPRWQRLAKRDGDVTLRELPDSQRTKCRAEVSTQRFDSTFPRPSGARQKCAGGP